MNKILVTLLFIMALPIYTSAKVGVGVNTGKIQVNEQLKAGMIHQLPAITVINTGDEPAVYKLSVSYQQDQKYLVPQKKWFSFSPEEFALEPGEAKMVEIKLTLPMKTEPGDYFCYLEARPATTKQQGNTSVGVAAAGKLYFSVAPANFFIAMYHRISSIYSRNKILFNILFSLTLFGIIVSILRKYIHLEIKTNKKIEEQKPEEKKFIEEKENIKVETEPEEKEDIKEAEKIEENKEAKEVDKTEENINIEEKENIIQEKKPVKKKNPTRKKSTRKKKSTQK